MDSRWEKQEEHWLCRKSEACQVYAHPTGNVSFDFGEARVRSVYDGKKAAVRDSEMTFFEDVSGGVNFHKPHIVLYACLEGCLTFEDYGLELRSDQILLFRSSGLSNVGFQADVRNRVITVELFSGEMLGLRGETSDWLASYFGKADFFLLQGLSFMQKSVLQQLVQCAFAEKLRSFYIEAKIVEFITVFLHETTGRRTEERLDACKLSREDVQCLVLAKEILDQSYVAPPTVEGLSRKICLNIFKLKNGFKQMFGNTVHGYVIDKRLEHAERLLTEKDLTIGQVASCIGYANASHFAAAFRKKTGFTPREYRLNWE